MNDEMMRVSLFLGISKVPGFHGGPRLSGYSNSEDAGEN